MNNCNTSYKNRCQTLQTWSRNSIFWFSNLFLKYLKVLTLGLDNYKMWRGTWLPCPWRIEYEHGKKRAKDVMGFPPTPNSVKCIFAYHIYTVGQKLFQSCFYIFSSLQPNCNAALKVTFTISSSVHLH